ncbi:uncharacterized protein LOC113519398 [Galleria mellonella]|uniref:Uncharacterized protein LOC113519398 n=1 Tax=Galleria mellonella TaxID=7137 RepID=A0ABM3MNL6_GALME|nr:uncharacterized protein LOC113519398 [Galleria mellonella]
MEQVVVKTEVQGDGEIFLFYVDDGEQTAVTIDNLEDQVQQYNDTNTYAIETADEMAFDTENSQIDPAFKEKWLEEETQRLLMFFVDNKETFLNRSTQRKHLWAVACKTMLPGKTPAACDIKLRNLKRKYSQLLLNKQKGVEVKWPLYDACHLAFQDDVFVKMTLAESITHDSRIANIPIQPKPDNDGIVVVKNINQQPTRSIDSKVEMMLKLYLKYKKDFEKEYWRKDLWERIAFEMKEKDPEYWHKRFLNFKQHYLRVLSKRSETGEDSVNWPYTRYFDEIFADNSEFQRKYGRKDTETTVTVITDSQIVTNKTDWDETEVTVLAKYHYDCFDEFQDPTIPDDFLWNEVSRLLDKKPEQCKKKFEDLKLVHLDKYIEGGYNIRNRKPLDIVLDNIISKEIDIQLCNNSRPAENWKEEELDELVNFFYDNIEMFKDQVCYFVCWASVSKKSKRSILSCKKQWEELTNLYRTILEDKKDNPDMQIHWRYIELFDRIFDYGMDMTLMDGYEKLSDLHQKKETEMISVKKVNIDFDTDNMENVTDEEEYDERGYTKRSKRGIGDSKAFKILEFYQKNKDKFSTTVRKKQALWEILANQIGLSAEQCAHRFRNLKQVYTGYVQREIDRPEMPILWPYYALCKKVFGYRAIKSKLKNNKFSAECVEEWTAKEIKQLINYFAKNFNDLSEDLEEKAKWSDLSEVIGKSEDSCIQKFMDLRKSYRKLKTMRENNPQVKVSWKYYNLFDQIYSFKSENVETIQEVEMLDQNDQELSEKYDSQEEDYQCIIVIPEGQDVSDIENAQIIIKKPGEEVQMDAVDSIESKPPTFRWTKRTKKKLLLLYLNYVRARKGREINSADMWAEIASKLPDKTPLSCRKMFAKLKSDHTVSTDDANGKKTPYHALVEKILKIKPRFVKSGHEAQGDKHYKDVQLPAAKVEQGLQYYLLNIEEFLNPIYDKKYLWTELAKFISEPVSKIFNKINYLKQFYDIEKDEVAGGKTLFSELLKEIVTKEKTLKGSFEKKPMVEYSENDMWSDEEVEQLLTWYQVNLEKFKNPKYVRKYLWVQASNSLKKSPLACSKKMSEIRTQYRNMMKDSAEDLNSWRFYYLCQQIYGTGKKNIEQEEKSGDN